MGNSQKSGQETWMDTLQKKMYQSGQYTDEHVHHLSSF